MNFLRKTAILNAITRFFQQHERLGANLAQYLGRMGRDDELDVGERLSQLGYERTLPGWVKVQLGFVNHDHGLGLFEKPIGVGQVRMRIVGEKLGTDLRGPNACELYTPDDLQALQQK